MIHLFSMMFVVVIGALVLMFGILFSCEHNQSFISSIKESLIWGGGFFISFGAEVLLLTQI